MPADATLDELDFLRAYATHVGARLARPATLAVERPVTLRPSVPAWFADRADAAARRLERTERRTTEVDFPTPWQIATWMMNCQKPFQLWNVERSDWKDRIAFERGLEFKIGKAAAEHGPSREGRPGTVTPATAIARAGDAERAAMHSSAWEHRAWLFRGLLSQDARKSGLGRPDDAPKKPASSPGTNKPVLGDDDIITSWSAPPDFGK